MALTKTRASTSAVGRRDEIKDIIEEALEPSKNKIASLPGKECLDEITTKINKINEKLEAQEIKVKSLEDRLDIIESKLVRLENLDKRTDDGE